MGFNGSIVLSSVLLGVLVGSIVCFLVTKIFSGASLTQWGWRIPFCIALVFGAVALPLRLGISESPVFERIRSARRLSNRVCKFPCVNGHSVI